MDKPGADVQASLESVVERLGAVPLLLQLPIGTGREFSGVVDLIDMNKHVWSSKSDGGKDGQTYVTSALTPETDSVVYQEAVAARTQLIEQIAVMDDSFGDVFLNASSAADDSLKMDIVAAVRRLTVSGRAVPVVCGSSLRNTGVQLLMDAAVAWLPDPTERKHDCVEHYKSVFS